VGQKVHPRGFRLGVYEGWDAYWYPRNKSYAQLLQEDLKIRAFIDKKLANAEIAKVEIEKAGGNIRVVLHSARPGVVIGKKGQEINALRTKLARLTGRESVDVSVQEVKKPELDALVVAKSIAEQLERRASFKKVLKKASAAAMKSGARGINICVAGRLGGAEIARDEWIRVGSVPRHTLRANINYGRTEAYTTYGIIGVKVWVCRGDYTFDRKK
jgi:small subunit ribosomal protein S3